MGKKYLAGRRKSSWQAERLEDRRVLANTTVFEHDGVAYFLDAKQPGFARYDIQKEQWLSRIDLPADLPKPTVATADDDGLYVAHGTAVFRYRLDGSGQVPVISTDTPVIALHTDGQLLFISHSLAVYARFLSIDKATNTLISTINAYYHVKSGSAIAPGANRIFGRSTSIDPADIAYVPYQNNGVLSNVVDSPYHGHYESATQTWVFDDGSKVVDDSGAIYSIELVHINRFLSKITDIDFVGGQVPVILTENKLTAYSVGILPTGEKLLAQAATDLFVNDRSALAFTPDITTVHGYTVQVVPLTELAAPKPGQAVDPVGVRFTPDATAVAQSGQVLVFSKAHRSIFQFDPVAQAWKTTIPLLGTPSHFAYSKNNNTIYLGYDTGLIRKIDLSQPNPSEVPFVTRPSPPLALVAVGNAVFLADAVGSWISHYTYGFDGHQISSAALWDRSSDFAWSESNSKLYQFRVSSSPNDLIATAIAADGTIKDTVDSPHEDYFGWTPPIRVSPDGKTVILGSGNIHDGRTLTRLPQSLGTTVTDVAWLGNSTFTIREVANFSILQKWAPATYFVQNVVQFRGKAVSITALSDNRLLAISVDESGVPDLRVLDHELNIIPSPRPSANAGADVSMYIGTTFTLDGSKSSDLDSPPQPLTFAWRMVSGPGSIAFGSPAAATTTIAPDVAGTYEIELSVSDGIYTAQDLVRVTAKINLAPEARITTSTDVAFAQRSPLPLNGTTSTDANGDLLFFRWEVLTAPPDAQFSLQDAGLATARLSAGTPGEYLVQLTVSDGLLSKSTTKTLTFKANQAPILDTSPSKLTAVAGRTSAILDASRTTDADSDSLTFRWELVTKPAGAITSFSTANRAVTQFTANTIGEYSIRLTTSDGLISSDQVITVNIVANSAPVADTSRSQNTAVANRHSAKLDGTASLDPDGDAITYAWQVLERPPTSEPMIAASTNPVSTFSTNVPGTYVLNLTVSDGLLTAQQLVTIVVGQNQPPVADTSFSTRVVAGIEQPSQLNAHKSSDPDDTVLTYQWRVVASSNAKTPVIANPTQAITTLTATDPGVYAIELKVSDGLLSDTDVVMVTFSGNQLPVPDSTGSDRVVPAGTQPMLNATHSYDPDGDTLEITWSVLASTTDQIPLVTSPHSAVTSLATAQPGSYTLELQVYDGQASAKSIFIVTIHPSPVIAGDMDADGDVDSVDLLALVSNWTGVLEAGHGNKRYDQGDLDRDGDVDSVDLAFLIEAWTGANNGRSKR